MNKRKKKLSTQPGYKISDESVLGENQWPHLPVQGHEIKKQDYKEVYISKILKEKLNFFSLI